MTITITGASDDLIEINGAIYEEFGYHEAQLSGDLLGFSDGTLLRIKFDEEGVWRITRLAPGTAVFTLEQATDDGCTDTATLTGNVTWALHGSSFARAK